jgi:hypothetical protein
MITPSYSATATERVLPRMALDFTTGVLDPRVTVTRALNTATRVNSSGFIEIVNANLPRFDYKPTTLAPNGLLIEEARTNIALQSQAIETASWVKTNATVSADAIISPDGTLNADKLVENTANGTHDARSNQTTTAAVHTFSVYLKAAERNFVMLLHGQTSTAQVFNLNTGVTDGNAGFSAPVSSGVVNAGNGWYRVFITVNATAAVNSFRVYMMTDNVTYTYTGDGASGIFFGGAQIEAGAFATSYIPTTTTTLTRNADVVSMTGTNFSDWFNQSEGAFVTEADTVNPFSRWFYTVNDGSSTNYIGSDFNSSANVRFRVVNTGASQASVTSVAAVSANTIIKHAAAYATNSFNQALNGVLNTTDTTGSFVAMSQLQFSAANANPNLNGHIRSFRYYPQRLTNAELQAFST